MAKELHDGLGQELLILKNQAMMLASDLPVDRPEWRDRAEQMARISQQAIEGARAMAHNLRPAELDRVGLTAALTIMIERTTSSAGMVVDADLEHLDRMLPPEAEVQLYRIAQELMNNVLKHSAAKRVMIDLRKGEGGEVELVVADNGRGFVESEVSQGQASGLGLESVRERVAILGGEWVLETRRGGGTRVTVRIPRQV